MKVYIAGPVTGRPDLNRPAFDAAAVLVRDAAATPVNPHRLSPAHEGPCPPGPPSRSQGVSHPYGCWMRSGLRALLDCDAIAPLAGWRESRGATLEMAVAEACGIPVWDLAGDGRP